MQNVNSMTGTICLTDIKKEWIKVVKCKDNVTRKYLRIAVYPLKNDGMNGETHTVKCSEYDKPENGQKRQSEYIGTLTEWAPKTAVTEAEIAAGHTMQPDEDDLPF